MACCRQKIPIRGVLAVIGGFIIHLTIGTQLTFGNMNPYFVSYIRKESSPSDLKYVDGIWVQACMLMGQGVTMFLGGILEHKLGLRLSCLLGCWFLSAGVVLTHWTLQFNYVTSVLTYGVMFGLGCGVAYPIPVTCAMRWFPNHRGLMGGLIFVGFGMGSTVFNQIITLYLNPHNLAPDLTVGEDVYFTQDKVLERVPDLFLVLGGTYAAMQLLGVILMVNPPTPHEESTAQEQGTSSVQQNGASPNTDGEKTAEKIWHTHAIENNMPAPADVANISTNDKRPSENQNRINSSGTLVDRVTSLSVTHISVNFVADDESVHIGHGQRTKDAESSEKCAENGASSEKHG